VAISSTPGLGTKIIMKLPVTLAIIEGMNIRVGESIYTIPITDVKESFRPKPGEAFSDPERKEMIMVRGNCYPIIRLHRLFDIDGGVQNLSEGILIMAENGEKTICLFADELLGQQEVVVKAMPRYLKKIDGLSGCTLLGDGQISLILDIRGIVSMRNETAQTAME
jgi:two-component system chemotaxis sensor kinase CheA